MDAGERETEKGFNRTRRELNRVYSQAKRELRQKIRKHVAEFTELDKQMRGKLERDEITPQEYARWQRENVWKGKMWQGNLDAATRMLADVNREALKIVNGQRIGVFAENASYQNFCADRAGIVGVWDIYDEATVARLLEENPELLPPKALKENKDVAWNRRNINNCITQGIIQGESIDGIADRIAEITGSKNRNQMLRTARTAMTSAQNAGRIEAMHEQMNMGIRVQKKWIATLDKRTRDAHQDLDGDIVDVDEPFESELGKIMFPGDPEANPSNVYNCRCCLGYEYPDFPQQNSTRRDNETGDVIEYKTYKEWYKGKFTKMPVHNIAQGKDITGTWNRREGEYKFEIQDVIAAQGFDGFPQVVDQEAFDAAVRAANGGNGFIAQRTYSAPDQETLDSYMDMLYKGEWYVDCSTGGAQYGQGMYCAADYNGKLTDGIQNEMEHYANLGKSRLTRRLTDEERIEKTLQKLPNDLRENPDAIKYIKALQSNSFMKQIEYGAKLGGISADIDRAFASVPLDTTPVSRTETLTLMPDAKIVSWREINDIRMGNLDLSYRQNAIDQIVTDRGYTADEATFVKYNLGAGVEWDKVNAAAKRLGPERREQLIEEYYNIGEEATRRYNEEHERRIERARMYQEKYHDIGALAAALGYDAINSEGHGQSGSYTVILNRTKVLFLRSKK